MPGEAIAMPIEAVTNTSRSSSAIGADSSSAMRDAIARDAAQAREYLAIHG